MKHNDEPNTTEPTPEPTPDELGPLDAFERAWVGKLAEPEPELSRSAESFVQGVLDKHGAAQQRPAIIGRIGDRIGAGPVPYAAAAAVLIAALVGWYMLTGNGTGTDTPDSPNLAEQPNTDPADGEQNNARPTQPDPAPRVTQVDATKIPLGRMIAQTQTTVTQRASNLTAPARETPQALRMDRLLDLINSPVPDLKEWLAPLKQNNDQQSRA